MTTQLSIQHLSFSYEETPVLDNLSFILEQGQIGCILGNSGSGKSTLLRLIAGFIPLEQGQICIGNFCVSSALSHLEPHLRKVGFVFQDWALFPHLTAEENIKFGLLNATKAKKETRCQDLAKIFQIEPYLKRFPHELSGGQQQRIAIARALAPEPQILLMDEPFSNLDVSLKETLTLSLKSIFKSLGTTVLWVTHDPETALMAADRIGNLEKGNLTWWETPEAYCASQTTYSYLPGDLFLEEKPVLVKRLSRGL